MNAPNALGSEINPYTSFTRADAMKHWQEGNGETIFIDMNAHTLLCSVHTIYVDKAKRSGLGGGAIALGLIKGVETWAAARNAKEIMVYDTSGICSSMLSRFLGRLNFKAIGGNFRRNN